MTRPPTKPPKIADNLKTLPAGTAVLVRNDFGELIDTVTQSAPWQLGHGAWVVKLRDLGNGGGYDLARVKIKGGA